MACHKMCDNNINVIIIRLFAMHLGRTIAAMNTIFRLDLKYRVEILTDYWNWVNFKLPEIRIKCGMVEFIGGLSSLHLDKFTKLRTILPRLILWLRDASQPPQNCSSVRRLCMIGASNINRTVAACACSSARFAPFFRTEISLLLQIHAAHGIN